MTLKQFIAKLSTYDENLAPVIVLYGLDQVYTFNPLDDDEVEIHYDKPVNGEYKEKTPTFEMHIAVQGYE